jgi:DNA-binding IclR family transcriptional regulator
MEDDIQASHPIKATKLTFEILQGLKELNGAGVTELADHLGRSKSSVHNYLSTLREEEFVVKDGTTYDIGLRFLDLGTYARNKTEVYSIAKPELDDLVEETGELVNLLVEEHGRGVYLYRGKGSNAVEVDSYTGHRVHLHNTALGKAILAEMTENEVRRIIDRHGLPATSENTITDEDELFDELERIREQGVAFDREERLPGLRCVACAVTDNRGNIAGSVSVSGPTSRMQGERFTETLPEKLNKISNILSLNITYS